MNNSFRLFLALCLITNGVGCSSTKEKSFSDKITAGRCDEALLELPGKDPLIHLASESKQAAGTILSYSIVGASYTTEVLWDVAGGTVMVIALCAVPLAVVGGLYVAAGSNLNHSSPNYYSNDHSTPNLCFPGKITALGAPPLGRQSIEATKEMRCPDLKSLSHSFRQLASCYETSGKPEDLAKAENSIKALQNSHQFFQCLPLDEQQKISNQLVMIQNRRTGI